MKRFLLRVLPFAVAVILMAVLRSKWSAPDAVPVVPAAVDLSGKPAAAALETLPSVRTEPVISGISSGTDGEAGAGFKEWTGRYLDAAPAQRPGLVAEGVVLAGRRRPVFKQLIQSDPQRALLEAVPMVVRQDLPAEVTALLEERVNRRGVLRVYQGVGLDNAAPAPTHRIAELETGRTYAAHVYGRRTESVQWVADASVNGVALDNDLAVNENPFRPLEVGERPDPDKPAVAVCPVSGKDSVDDEWIGQPIVEATPAVNQMTVSL